jgi:flagellar hook assembly protein FlgD
VNTPVRTAHGCSLAAPRPIRDGFEVNVTLPEASFVTVAVFDERGGRVRDLEAGLLPAGVHTLRWDGRDGQARLTPPGVYLVRLEADGGTLVQTCVRLP